MVTHRWRLVGPRLSARVGRVVGEVAGAADGHVHHDEKLKAESGS
jgi:hypothetical protein